MVLSHPDVYAIQKAKKLLIVSWFSLAPKRTWTGETDMHFFSHGKSLSLQDQEQSLLDAIAKLDEASDGESGKLPWVVRILELARLICLEDNEDWGVVIITVVSKLRSPRVGSYIRYFVYWINCLVCSSAQNTLKMRW